MIKLIYTLVGLITLKVTYDYFFGDIFIYAKDKNGKNHKIKVGIKDTEDEIKRKINIYMKNL